jgi:hypothetical protein
VEAGGVKDMTIGEERDVFKQIGDLSSKISHLKSEIYNAKKKFKTIQIVIDRSFTLSDYDKGLIQGYQNVLNMFGPWIRRNTEKEPEVD